MVEDPTKATDRYLSLILNQAEEKAGIALSESLIEALLEVERLSNFMLIVAGASITLSLANAADVVSVLGVGSLKVLLLLLLLSALAGVAAKTCHMISNGALALATSMIDRMSEIYEEYKSEEQKSIDQLRSLGINFKSKPFDTERIKQSFANTIPHYLRKKVTVTGKGTGDSAYLQRIAFTYATFQLIAFGLQMFLALVAFLVATLGME